MIIFKSLLKNSKAVILLLCIVAIYTISFSAFSQNIKSGLTSDQYSMSFEPGLNKPKLQYFQVRLKGDPGISLIDLNGNIIARNFAPVINSYGKIKADDYTSPVIDDIFSVVRDKKKGSELNDSRISITIYRNASSPTPIPGLTDLYSANIINPNLFPTSRYGERIKFVDKNGKEKFTVLPIDGHEPSTVSPLIFNGLIIVEVDDGLLGAINTMGKWVIYPEWRDISVLQNGSIMGLKINGEIYEITLTDKLSKSSRFETSIDYYDLVGSSNGKYHTEEFFDNGLAVNIYDKDNKYITTLYNTYLIRFNHNHPDLLLVRCNSESGPESYECLIDINKDNKIVSKQYSHMEVLPDGNYLAYNKTSKSDIRKCWFVKTDGSEVILPDNTLSPLNHPAMALLYNGTVKNFIVKPTAEKSGYICNKFGAKVGNIEIEEYYPQYWEPQPVKSSYYYRTNLVGTKSAN